MVVEKKRKLDWCTLSLKEREYTMIEPEAFKIIIDCVRSTPKNGTIAIAGTAHGGDAMAIRTQFPEKKLIVIDSFQGLDNPTEEDEEEAEQKGGHSCGGLDQYKANFADMKVPLPHEIYEMWIDTNNLKKIKDNKYGMLFMDLDHYAPVKACLDYFYNKMLPGGIILTHDYGFFRTKGVKKACQEFAPGMWREIHGFAQYTGEF